MNDRPRRRVLYLARGGFAARVVRHRGVPAEDLVGLAELASRGTGDAEALIAIHSEADAEMREQVDRLGAERSLPTFGVQLMPTRLVCGPVVIPGRTACWSCYRKRTAQHAGDARQPDVDASVSGLAEGFGQLHVMVASSLIDLSLAEVRAGGPAPVAIGGTVRTMSLISGSVGAAETVAVDRCPRCSGRFAAHREASPEERFRELAR